MNRTLNRREFLKSAAAGLLATGAIGIPAWAARPSAGGRPNVLFIMTDQEPTYLSGCYGNKVIKTPARDAIANGGIRFDNHYIASFPCSPSRATMITGRYCHHHGMITNEILFDESNPTLAKALGAAGYETAWVGKSHLGGFLYRGLKQFQFDGNFYFERVPNPNYYVFKPVEGGVGEDGAVGGFKHWVGGWKDYQAYLRTTDLPDAIKNDPSYGCHNDAPSGPDESHAVSRLGERHHMDHFFADKVIQFLGGMKGADRPFCCVLSFYSPHHPVAPPEPWDMMYDLDQIELPPNFNDPLAGKPIPQRAGSIFVRPEWTDEEFKDYIRRYYGYVSYIDSQIQRVLDALKTNGQEDNTIVLFTTDHGDFLAQHGMIHKGMCGYDTLTKVPLLIRWPGRIPAGRVCEALVSNVDIMPTLVDLTGAAIPEGVDGRSLKDVVLGRSDRGRDEAVCDMGGTVLMLRQGEWKFNLNIFANGDVKGHQIDELYNLAEDPWEIKNLAGDPAQVERVHKMRDRLVAWLRETKHPYAETRAAAALLPPFVTRPIRPVLDRFEDLGGGRIRVTFHWRVTGDTADIPPSNDIVRVVQRVSKPRGNAVIEVDEPVASAERPATVPPAHWKAGDNPPASFDLAFPSGATERKYILRLGLVPGRGNVLLDSGYSNDMPVGELTLARRDDRVTLALRRFRQ
ncbi:MAG: sulfatase-like hydrolase/transferase [bacterium]|nr:sulfatase-like hydrolase/transferase [bacterium]